MAATPIMITSQWAVLVPRRYHRVGKPATRESHGQSGNQQHEAVGKPNLLDGPPVNANEECRGPSTDRKTDDGKASDAHKLRCVETCVTPNPCHCFGPRYRCAAFTHIATRRFTNRAHQGNQEQTGKPHGEEGHLPGLKFAKAGKNERRSGCYPRN